MIRVGPHVARVREVRLLTAFIDAWVVRGCCVGGQMRVAHRMKEGVSGAADPMLDGIGPDAMKVDMRT